MTDLAKEGITAKHVVTNADSSNYLAAVDVFESDVSDTQPIHNLDPMDLKWNQADKIKHASFRKKSISGVKASQRKLSYRSFWLQTWHLGVIVNMLLHSATTSITMTKLLITCLS